MNLLQPSICAHRLKSGATQTKPAYAGFNHNLLLVRVGGLGLYSRVSVAGRASRPFIRQVFLPEVYYLEGVQ